MKLSELKTGEVGVIAKVNGHGGFRKRLIEMGFISGKRVAVVLNAPLKDPIEYEILGYKVSLRRSEAGLIDVISEEEAKASVDSKQDFTSICDVDCDEVAALNLEAPRHPRRPRRQPELRKDITLQHRLRQPRARRQLQRRDSGREGRAF